MKISFQLTMGDRPQRGSGTSSGGRGRGGRGRGSGGDRHYRDSSSMAYGNQPLNPTDERQLKETEERMAAIPDTDRNLFLDYQTGRRAPSCSTLFFSIRIL